MSKTKKRPLRHIPQVEQLLNHPLIKESIHTHQRGIVVEIIRTTLSNIRRLSKKEFTDYDLSLDALSRMIIQRLKEITQPSLRRVINATGIVLHTGLGRALLPESARQALLEASGHYCNLEIDILSDERKERNLHIEDLLCLITGGESALVVNNNASAVLLSLNTIAQDKEVIVSRGHLVEIGGGFRLPEVISKSGAHLIEVGTTNKTYLDDYRLAINPETKAILRVHTSNFRMLGFVAEVGLAELVQLAHQKHIAVIDDLGSGALIDLSRYNPKSQWSEPMVQQSIRSGSTVVTFSGDKLLGGPQAGIIVGKKRVVDAMKRNPLYRAVRLDKLRLAALEATLKLYLNEEEAIRKIPVLEAILKPLEKIGHLAEELISRLNKAVTTETIKVTVEDGVSYAGGGTLPAEEIPTKLVAIQPLRISSSELSQRLRLTTPALKGRVYKNKLYLDMRTVRDDEIDVMFDILKQAII
ncbi:MAG: L-seryl-tRNA(Sec) selenium transferase [Planctomycetota bacterium]|nr:L-seryl-tRNA(Sec) selenium transferase [Planctomycetota bacterium]